MHKETLLNQLGTTDFVLKRNIEGVTDEDALVQPSAAGNCMNWVLGHIVRTRNSALGLLGGEPLYPPEKFEAYGEQPVTDGSSAIPWGELVKMYDELGPPLIEGIEKIQPAAMDQPAPFSPTNNPDETIGTLLVALVFHEAYHSGQIGLLRRVVGKAGSVRGPGAEVTA